MRYGKTKVYLSSPILYPTTRPWRGVTLDGLLGWIWARDKGILKTPAERRKENTIFPELPLAQIEPKLYAASTMFLPEAGREEARLIGSTSEIINKMGNGDISMRKQVRKGMGDFKFNGQSGAYRAGLVRYWALTTPFVEFYFAAEDWEAATSFIKRIKTGCFGIGAKARCGYGAISKVEWEEVAETASHHISKNGAPTRPIPVNSSFKGKFPDSTIGYCTWFPPYSVPWSREECYEPSPSQYLPRLPIKSFAFENALKAKAAQQKEIMKRLTEKKTA